MERSDARDGAAPGIRLRDRPDCLRATCGTPPAALVHACLHFPGTRGTLLGPREVAGGLEETATETALMITWPWHVQRPQLGKTPSRLRERRRLKHGTRRVGRRNPWR